MKNAKRTARDLIDAIVVNMQQNREELKYSTVAPSRYTVYLSAAEHARIEPLIPRLQAEATRALDEELARANRKSRLRTAWRQAAQLLGMARPPLENAGTQWHVEFLPDLDGELAADGDVIVHSDMLLPPDIELGSGERTRRITTVRMHGQSTSREQITSATPKAHGPVRARLTYRDNRGEHAHDVVRDRITIGRGGQAYPVDVRVSTSEDVSREHARIRRDTQTGQFFLIDVSTFGTTLNGRHVPRGAEVETALPSRARIGLAETVFIDFEEIAGSKDPASFGAGSKDSASFVRRSPGSSAQRSPGSLDPGML
jgi:hypothetical protein